MQHKRPISWKTLQRGRIAISNRMTIRQQSHPLHALKLLVALLLIISTLRAVSFSQTPPSAATLEQGTAALSQILRLERVPVAGGAELIIVHARLDGLESTTDDKWVPLVSILRDTLGDLNTENDRLRYVWPLTYTRPTVKQRLAAAIPFLYASVGNKNDLSQKPPPPAFNLAAPDTEVWEKIFWTALQNILLDPYGTPVKASTSAYRRNASDYRKSHIVRALSLLALYQAVKGEAAFTESEMAEIQGRLLLSDKTFGGLVDDSNLQNYSQRQTIALKDNRGHNWELLRQRAEAESLYFEPLSMPDGSPTHALVWVAKRDLEKRHGTRYNGRFLNVASPWSDKRLLDWKGYVETRYFDADSRPVDVNTPGAQAVELIPLALYGLDNPKIPMLLVDFRDGYNPKKREMSRRVLHDVTRNVLSLSKFGNLPFFLGRTVFDFVIGRRGIDINQPSRLQTYSQLKLLLSLTDSMQPELRTEVNGRLERISLNPFENDLEAEANVARAQYASLLAYAKDPNGLPAKLERDRRAELLPLEHGSKAQIFFRLANVFTFGKYVHREELTDDLSNRLDVARRLSYHTKFLEQVSKTQSEIDVTWNLEEVRRSLHFIAEHGTQAGNHVVLAAAKIFARTSDDQTRRACLESLSRISNSKAKLELQRISDSRSLDKSWRDIARAYLTNPSDREPISSVVGSPVKTGQP
ncbi:MAG: hypothetical protein ABR555_08140 [Pyrinomonadaceae bacterium]